MKRTFYLSIILVSLTFTAGAQSKAEKAVASTVERLRKAMLDGNKQELEAVAAEDLSYGHSSGKVQDKAEFVNAIVTGASDFVTLDLTEQTIKVEDKTAIVRHKLAAKTNDNGVAGTANIGVLLIFQKQHGDWKLLARQAFKL